MHPRHASVRIQCYKGKITALDYRIIKTDLGIKSSDPWYGLLRILYKKKICPEIYFHYCGKHYNWMLWVRWMSREIVKENSSIIYALSTSTRRSNFQYRPLRYKRCGLSNYEYEQINFKATIVATFRYSLWSNTYVLRILFNIVQRCKLLRNLTLHFRQNI